MSRPRLLAPLLGSSEPLVVLCAPAGYSKTTCLSEWAAADPRPFAWVTASRLHDDATLLVRAIVEGLDEIEPVDPSVLAALSHSSPSLSATVLPRLGQAIAERGRPAVLVVDDLENLCSPEAAEVLGAVAASLPVGSQLALGTRVAPDLPLGRMRAHRRLIEIGPGELAMTIAEARELLRAAGAEPSERGLELLHERTEGWPAALYLAGLALGEAEDPDSLLGAFAGDDRIVMDYLRDEFLSAMEPARLRFLMRTSILGELTGPLCDAVLPASGSGAVLDELARTNSLVLRLDRTGERYRYHHLFAEALRSELRRHEPGAEAKLHARASRWYAAGSRLDHAVEHAIAAGEADEAAELMWAAFPDLSSTGRIPTLERWLTELGDDAAKRNARLGVIAAHCAITMADSAGAAHWLRVAEAAREADGAPERRVDPDIALMRALLAPDGVGPMGREAEVSAEHHSEDSPWQVPCYFFRGTSSHLGGHAERARPLLREAARRGAISATVIQVLALGQLTLMAIDDGDTATATRLAAQARDQVLRCGLTDYPSVSMVYAASALACARAGRTERAHADAKDTRRLMARSAGMPPWYEAQLRVALAGALIRLDARADVEGLLDEAERFLAETPDAVLIGQWIQDARRALETAHAEGRSLEWALTPAEHRTLQYLPSHLSFREIGELIHVSPNTVKTQAQAVYRKLDATSRAEAVERAQRAGLLGGAPPPTSSDTGDGASAEPEYRPAGPTLTRSSR